jgi:hypothetical protein
MKAKELKSLGVTELSVAEARKAEGGNGWSADMGYAVGYLGTHPWQLLNVVNAYNYYFG